MGGLAIMGSGASVATESVPKIFDSTGQQISLGMLKRHDLLVLCLNYSIKGSVPVGSGLHAVLVELVKYIEGLTCRLYCECSTGIFVNIPLNQISQIHLVSRGPCGEEIMTFSNALYEEKRKAEKAAEQMRKNIDALKA